MFHHVSVVMCFAGHRLETPPGASMLNSTRHANCHGPISQSGAPRDVSCSQLVFSCMIMLISCVSVPAVQARAHTDKADAIIAQQENTLRVECLFRV